MKKFVSIVLISMVSVHGFGWGQTGHRVVGEIASRYLTKKARKNIEKILGNETIAMCSNHMDEIKSDRRFDHLGPWHYCTIPDGKTYEEAGTPEEGDIIMAINRIRGDLITKNFRMEDEVFNLKCLVHLVGDIHQPLHVGNGYDHGGNDVKVEYFWSSSSLHRVWDSGIIDQQNLSYSEYVNWIDHPTDEEIASWTSSSVIDWAYESMEYREPIYDLPQGKKINYRYNYLHIGTVNLRLLQAGIRLAVLLNEIYG
jgi:hypothetical protein